MKWISHMLMYNSSLFSLPPTLFSYIPITQHWTRIRMKYDFKKKNLLNVCCCCCKSLQSCPTLCDPRDDSPPGSPIPGIVQARTLEWVAISFYNAWKWKWSRSVVSDSAIPWTAAYQAPLSLGFSRQEYWSGVPLPSPHSQTAWVQIPALSYRLLWPWLSFLKFYCNSMFLIG